MKYFCFSDYLREIRSETKLNEAVTGLLKCLSTDFDNFEKHSEAILAKVKVTINSLIFSFSTF